MIEVGIFALINGNAPLMALLPGGFWPTSSDRGQQDFPYMTYTVVTASPSEYTLDGPEFEQKLFQFDVYEKSGTNQTRMILKTLHRLLDKFTGVLGDGTRVLFAERGNVINNFESDGDSYRSIAEYQIQFVEQD